MWVDNVLGVNMVILRLDLALSCAYKGREAVHAKWMSENENLFFVLSLHLCRKSSLACTVIELEIWLIEMIPVFFYLILLRRVGPENRTKML